MKRESCYYNSFRKANALNNIKKYPFIKEECDKIIKEADGYLEKYSLENIRFLPASQSLYRSSDVNHGSICPVCSKIMKVHLDTDAVYTPADGHPLWKIKCKKCGTVYPSNDFESYYKSALDERGFFCPEKGDRTLLKNTLYPEKGEGWCVDDGYGYIDEDGETLKRIRVFSGSKYQQFFVEPKTADLVARSYRFPNPGDVVRLSFSARGYINGFAIDVSYDKAAHSIKIHYDGGGYPGSYHGIEGGAASYMTYFGGRVVTAGNGFMAITPDQTPPSISGELGGVVNLNVSGATYMIYDRHTNDVYSASASDVITAMNAGEENASLIAGKSYYYNTNVIIIYAN